MDMKVRVVYRDAKLEPTYVKTYTLQEYTDMLRMNLMRVITDVEDLVYTMSGNKSKEDWSDETWTGFQHIKHKLLDNAGDIGRIPQNIIGGEENAEG